MTPLRRGWDPGPDDAYPEDLPEEWRLGYAANVLDAVLVPAGLWVPATRETLEQWVRDTPAGFSFYLEAPPAPLRPACWRRLRRALGDRLSGLVLSAGACGAGAHADAPAAWRCDPATDKGQGLAVRVPGAIRADLSQARGWVERLAVEGDGRSTLLLLEDLAIEQVHRWQILIDLLGIRRR